MEDFLSLMNKILIEDVPTGKYNISTGSSHSILQLFKVVAEYLGISLETMPEVVPPGPDDVPEVVLDPSQTEKLLGWRAKIGFEETIRRMLAWYDQFGVSAIYSHLQTPKTLKS